MLSESPQRFKVVLAYGWNGGSNLTVDLDEARQPIKRIMVSQFHGPENSRDLFQCSAVSLTACCVRVAAVVWQSILSIFFLAKEHFGPARPSDESCNLNRHVALGVTSADLQMIGVRRLDNRGIEVSRSEVWFRSFTL